MSTICRGLTRQGPSSRPVSIIVMANNPAPLAAATHTAEDHGDQLRAAMKVWAEFCISNRAKFTYSEGPDRSHMVNSRPGSLPQTADCSAFVTGLAKWAGASDPSGLGFDPVGYTGTLLAHCNLITNAMCRMGDLIVYGPRTGKHAVFVLEKLPKGDFWVASHGHQGDPGRVLHSTFMNYFNNSARYLRWLS